MSVLLAALRFNQLNCSNGRCPRYSWECCSGITRQPVSITTSIYTSANFTVNIGLFPTNAVPEIEPNSKQLSPKLLTRGFPKCQRACLR